MPATEATVAQTTYLKDYMPPNFQVKKFDLTFDIFADHTIVTSEILFKKNRAGEVVSLVLDGDELELVKVVLDGKELPQDQYVATPQLLEIKAVPDEFTLNVTTKIDPDNNKTLMGLYRAGDILSTQCESHGFRRMTYFLDRPDVLTKFTTKIIADKKQYPLLLSNGNSIEKGDLDDGRHFEVWEDPIKKPSYLFALVAGDLEFLEDSYKTMSGRNVVLRLFVEKGKLDQAPHAMQSIKKSMQWDEETYGREYDLDIFMVVAVSRFNMGAMENKGLNIFNDKYVLASDKSATDCDFEGILKVIGHEYFHNWTGNRVTCRDWFQLSLKEGLTVFRDQEFTSDHTERTVKRINDANVIRTAQFREDAGPNAHPIRPDSYIEMNNFYTVTVYNKGAEVIRMYQTLLGKDGFRKGTDLYFERHDGQAVTCDDFAQAMNDANSDKNFPLQQFKLWYSQAGTPELDMLGNYDEAAKTYTLHVKQSCPATPGQPTKQPFLIPLRMALIDENGHEIDLHLDDQDVEKEKVLLITETEQTFVFKSVEAKVIPSLLRNYSAPVKLKFPYSHQDLQKLIEHDSDDFNCWDAIQTYFSDIILGMVSNLQEGSEIYLDDEAKNIFGSILRATHHEPALQAQLLLLPSESYLAQQMDVQDPINIAKAREYARHELAAFFKVEFLALYKQNICKHEYRFEQKDVGMRALKNICLQYLSSLKDPDCEDLCKAQFKQSDNMTDTLSALSALANSSYDFRDTALQIFYEQWKSNSLVLDKWFSIQASSKKAKGVATVKELMEHEKFTFDNPNRVRAVVGSFCEANRAQFHETSGDGYIFLADVISKIDGDNPQLSAACLIPLTFWKSFDKDRQQLMKEQLEKIKALPNLSSDVFELVTKSLDDA